MIVWFSMEMTCPMCGSRLCGREVGGGFAVGQDTDLLVRMKGKHIIQAEIHTCQGCRYSGFTRDFAINTPPAIGDRFRKEIMPVLTGAPKGALSPTPLPDVQYYWSYRAAKFLERPALTLGFRLLRAYWCLRLAPSSRLPDAEIDRRRQNYLNGCILYFRQALRGNRNPHVYYLLGELNRRLGDYDSSVSYFEKFLKKRSTANYLRHAALKLISAAKDQDNRERTMEEILYDHKAGSS